MISPAGAEGINLYNVRQVHIMEPYYNEARMEQVIGRAVRQCHHADLPQEERKVDIFRYKMIRKNAKETTDQKIENRSREKNNLLISFVEAVKEVAIDCELFKAHNMMGSKYNCFKFNEDSLLDKPIGPAFNQKIEYDQKIDNGSNSKEAERLKIKVRKIKAVKKIEENIYSEPDTYWYYEPSGMIYDYDMQFPVGKVDKENKLDGNIYIIEHVIDIPDFKIYE
jgi:superfamily II DNA or RNA helicase